MAQKFAKQVEAVLSLQRCIRGYHARVKYTDMLWESFQEEEEQQRMLVEKHMSEGLELVHAAKQKQEEEKQKIVEKSSNFVQKDKEHSAIMVLQRVMRMTTLARRAKARVRARKEEEARARKAKQDAKAASAADPATDRPDSGGQPQVKKRAGLPLISKKNVPPPPTGKPNKSKQPAKELSKIEIRQRLTKLNQRRQQLIRSLARALKTKGSDLHQLQRNLKDVSIEIQELLQLQARAM